MRRTNRRKLQSNGCFPCAKTSSFPGQAANAGLWALWIVGSIERLWCPSSWARAQCGGKRTRNQRERERTASKKRQPEDWETSNLDSLNYLNTAPGCVSVVWFHPKSLLTSREPLISFAPCLTFLTGTPRLAPNTCRSPTLLGLWKLKNSTILRAQGIMLQFRTMSNLESQRCKQNLTPGFWKHLKHLRQKSQWVSERPSERVRVCLRMCAGASEWVIGCSGGVVVWAVNQDNLALVDGLIDLWLIGRSFFCLYICLFIKFMYLLIHYSIVIGELCVGCMTELSKSFLLAVERDTKTPWRIPKRMRQHQKQISAWYDCSASVLQHWVQERVLKTLERS